MRAFREAGIPRCLGKQRELAAPLVVELGQTILAMQLCRPAAMAELARQQVAESTYDELGGPAYANVCRAMDESRDRYFARVREFGETCSSTRSEIRALRRELEAVTSEFEELRSQAAADVESRGREARRAFWRARPFSGIPDTLLAHVDHNCAAARLPRIHPVWWGSFFGRLQTKRAHSHPAEGYLLDALPHLRTQRRLKFASAIDEWRAANNDRWGWYTRVHDRMLARRAKTKARQLAQWFDSVAPGYLDSDAVHFDLHDRLAAELAHADPWQLLHRQWPAWTEPGRN